MIKGPIGVIFLAVYLILVAVVGLTAISLGIVPAIIALVAGILILLGK